MAPHYKQSSPGACLPACARMVLAALGDERSEAELAAVMESYDFGTPANRVTRLEKLNYRVKFGPSSLEELRVYLEQGFFPIVFVYAGFLPWAKFEGFHALVLTQVTPTEVMLLDPALDEGPSQLSLDGFLMAWEEFDSLTAIILQE
jgi:ABC-type bacteriocin/lantibiotic exporter with double-glycine peptidase domain